MLKCKHNCFIRIALMTLRALPRLGAVSIGSGSELIAHVLSSTVTQVKEQIETKTEYKVKGKTH